MLQLSLNKRPQPWILQSSYLYEIDKMHVWQLSYTICMHTNMYFLTIICDRSRRFPFRNQIPGFIRDLSWLLWNHIGLIRYAITRDMYLYICRRYNSQMFVGFDCGGDSKNLQFRLRQPRDRITGKVFRSVLSEWVLVRNLLPRKWSFPKKQVSTFPVYITIILSDKPKFIAHSDRNRKR